MDTSFVFDGILSPCQQYKTLLCDKLCMKVEGRRCTIMLVLFFFLMIQETDQVASKFHCLQSILIEGTSVLNSKLRL